MPWVGRHVGTPCLLMWALASTSPALVGLAGCRVLLHVCPWQVDWEQELRSLEEILIVNPPRDGAGRGWGLGVNQVHCPHPPAPQRTLSRTVEFHAPDPRVPWRTTKGDCAPQESLSVPDNTGGQGECGVLTLRDPSPGRQRSSRSGGGGAGGMAFTVDRRASRGAGQWPAGTLRPPPGHLLSIVVKGKQNKTKPNGRTGLRTGERENASQQSQPTPSRTRAPRAPAFRPCRAGRMYRGLGGSRTVPHKDHGGAGQAGPLAPLGQLGLGGRGQPQAA